MKLLFCLLALMALPAPAECKDAASAVLTVESGGQSHGWTREELRQEKNFRTIQVEKDPSYPGGPRTYEAVPAADLFAKLPLDKKGSLLFHCADGFAAPISIPLLLASDPKGAVAYLAVENPEKPWPPLAAGKGSAGPYYLVWTHPEKAGISNEQWPFQLTGFSWQASAEEKYPHTAPDPKLAASSPVRKGYAVFQKNCFSCHRLNGEGEASQMGPDLNLPYSPTEYFAKGYLQKLVRNPQNLRRWKESRMPAFSKDIISDEDLGYLEAYLKHMAGRKVKGS